ncbi:3-hydroxyisobutyrate dehydrogenase, NAD-binding domain,6-phosphogluconate dehydrogenase, NADP-binding,6- [Cinara cedri]|uniref:Cytokine-like nuclear factor N-PAC n=1 Tax=Cinara cedri TaxID=506608 RepID=A0A5E4LZT1_9HEMI|nr:3-hydroxyisobutyrate dehydrogenase, NAD-binding domain,6-phosphogluconate dehydrogenase, NADP-binding,6- [Cinara cedri]
MAIEWKYKTDDLVWAKTNGFPPWPGRVSEPPSLRTCSKKNNSRYIFFFGCKNYAWIETGCLKPYLPYKNLLTDNGKTQHFKEACRDIEDFIKTGSGKKNNRVPVTETLVRNKTPKVVKELSAFNTPCCSSTVNSTSGSIAKKRKNKSLFGKSLASNSDEAKSKPKKSRVNLSTDNVDVFINIEIKNNYSNPQGKNNNLLNSPEVIAAESTSKDVSKVSKYLSNKNMAMKFGFIGLGNIGTEIVKNLLKSGHTVIVWNRSPEKCQQFLEIGATAGITPSDVVIGSDIIFSCVSNPRVVKDIIFGNDGILSNLGTGKSFVEMSGVDPETSQDIGDAISSIGGRYMEAVIQGSKTEAGRGSLVCMAAGDKGLFDDCQSVFGAIAKKSLYLGEIGSATKMNLILHTIKSVFIAGLAEGVALADRAGISSKCMIDILARTSLKCPLLLEKEKATVDKNFLPHQALNHSQKDLSLSLNLAEDSEQSCPVSATVNEVLKNAKRLGFSDLDTS